MESVKEMNREWLDPEWVELMLIAKEIGLIPEEIRNFLKQTGGSCATSSRSE